MDRFFTTTKKGEIYELKADLNSERKEKKKEAVKKVISSMTVGKDVGMLFADVLKCMQTDDLELKKLVYLYLMNYAKLQPELVILVVNSFIKDTDDPNPLLRALAIRTMGCIRVERILDYLCEPLRKCLKDVDPYVRKTAALCVAKLYDLNPSLVEENDFLDLLKETLSDANPVVVANAVAALGEIYEVSGERNTMVLDGAHLSKLLAALNECTEWGQIFILDSLAKYQPIDGSEAENICERIMPRLQHANPSVVLSAVKLIINYIPLIDNEDFLGPLGRKLSAPLVTLLSSEAEVQYVALRNINLVLQKRPTILNEELRVFFCKYNDAQYVKLEKLEIIIKLANESNMDQILSEFKEYATEIDVEFVRKSIRAIGQCAIKIESSAGRCVNVLLELIETKVNYVIQESIIVIRDIFRKYPNRFEGVIPALCENLENLTEPEAKASIIWIIGEYAERISNSIELLDYFMINFRDDDLQVQLQLLTATVKAFLKRPAVGQTLVQTILQLATDASQNPDLRDRGFIYWRLLSIDPHAAKSIVLSDKPTIENDTNEIDVELLDELMKEISTLASVFHRPASSFIRQPKHFKERYDNEESQACAAQKENTNLVSQNVVPNHPLPSLIDFETIITMGEPEVASINDASPVTSPQSNHQAQTVPVVKTNSNNLVNLFGS